MKIWKWTISQVDRQVLVMPAGAQILTAQFQLGDLRLWALCDEKAPTENREIAIYGTGNPMPDDPGKYIGTFQFYGGTLIFHVFDLGVQAR